MTMTELLPTLSELNRAEKLRVMHYLVAELEKDETLLTPGVYPIWSPYGSYGAANALLQALSEEDAEQSGAGGK